MVGRALLFLVVALIIASVVLLTNILFAHRSVPVSLSYRPRRTGERKRKSVRGCIVGSDLSVLNLGSCSVQ